jgi:membrane protein
LIESFHQFITRDIWKADFTKVSNAKTFFYIQLQLIYFVMRSFIRDRLLIRASALVYATLLSIVPLLAFMFSLLKAFGFHNKLKPTLEHFFQPLGQQAVEMIVPRIVGFVDNINVGVIGAAGFFVLFFSTLSIINNIETAFNDIWRIKETRSLHRRISDYLSLILLGPVFVFAILGVTASLQSNAIVQAISKIPGIQFLFNTTAPFIASITVFLVFLKFVPNTKVKFHSALLGAVITGSLWQFSNWFFAHVITTSYQVGSKAAIYAGFATLPLFLVWLYIGWAIVLLGAEISFVNQNLTKLAYEKRNEDYSQYYLETLTLKIIFHIALRFQKGKTPPSTEELSKAFNIPEYLVNTVLQKLLAIKVIFSSNIGSKDSDFPRYVPAQSMESLTVYNLIQKLRKMGNNPKDKSKPSFVTRLVNKIQQKMDSSIYSSFDERSIIEVIRESKQ